MSSFDLKESISQWKKSLLAEQGLEPGIIEELEANLLDRIDDFLEEGLTPDEAFKSALEKSMPESAREVANEYHKVNGGKKSKPPWQRNRYLWNRMPLHLKVAVRNLSKRKAYAALSIGGLAISLCASMLIWLYVQDQSSYDQHYGDVDRIYRVIYDVHLTDEHIPQADVGQPVGPTLKAEFPEVVEYGRIRRIGASNTLETKLFKIESQDIFVADTTFLKVFNIPFSSGNPETALEEPNTIVIAESLALALFGEVDVVGRTIRYSGVKPPMNIKVTGVFPDLDRHTHLPLKAMVSYSTYFEPSDLANWLRKSYTYIKLDESNNIKSLAAKMPGFSVKYLKPVFDPLGGRASLLFQPLTSIYLGSEYLGGPYSIGSQADLQILTAIMIFLLVMSCINYVNMATARSVDRAMEVGIKKTMGSSRFSLMVQFITEAVLLALFAGIIAILLSMLLLKPYASVTGIDMGLFSLLSNENLMTFGLLTGTVGILSGLYPAFYLSGFRPGNVLKGKFATSKRGAWLRKSLILTQYVIATVLISGILVVAKQTHFIKTKDIGFVKDGLIEIPMPDDISLNHKSLQFMDQVRLMPRIRSAALGNQTMYEYRSAGALNMVYESTGPEKAALSYVYVGQEFVKTIGANMVGGRGFDPKFNNEYTFIINEKAVAKYGWDQFQELKWPGWNGDENWQCVGVVSDFNLGESYRDHEPMILLHSNYPNIDAKIYIGIANKDMAGALVDIQAIWEDNFPGHSFDYSFVENQLEELYASDELFLHLIMLLGVIIVMVTVIGIVGLISFTTEIKRKEIALRKVSGASIKAILILLSRQFLGLVLMAMVFAVPVSVFLSEQWLNNFAQRTGIGFWPYLLAFPLCLLMTAMAVVYHALRAARANPVEALRAE